MKMRNGVVLAALLVSLVALPFGVGAEQPVD